LTKETEFHAGDILSGNNQFKGWDWDRRIDTLKRLITIIGTAQGLGKVYVKMDVEKMWSSDVEGMAFMLVSDTWISRRSQAGTGRPKCSPSSLTPSTGPSDPTGMRHRQDAVGGSGMLGATRDSPLRLKVVRPQYPAFPPVVRLGGDARRARHWRAWLEI
jgi:hypothetical protein